MKKKVLEFLCIQSRILEKKTIVTHAIQKCQEQVKKISGIFDQLWRNEKMPTSIELFSINTKPKPILFIVFFDSVPEHRQLFQF